MEPLTIDRTHILVLNFNGRGWLEECLPTHPGGGRAGAGPLPVTVVDNGSTDDSCEWLARRWPDVGLVREPNLGLASFNRVLERLDEPVVLLLNNDIKLDPDSVGPLLQVFETPRRCPLLRPDVLDVRRSDLRGDEDAGPHAIRPRSGDVPGARDSRRPSGQPTRPPRPVRCWRSIAAEFLGLGGYDPIYFPGRIEDLDLGFRGWMAGYRGYYVPESVAYHWGFGTFGPNWAWRARNGWRAGTP